MTCPSPSPEAMERLRVFGERELLAFMDEVTTKTNKELLSVLPSVDGFRKDSVNSLPTRKRAMLNHFLKKGEGKASNKAQADVAYYYFWRSWAEQHLPDVDGLADELNAIEHVATKSTSPSDTLDKAVERLFKNLQQQSFLNRCSSEKTTRLLNFSPFSITDTLDRLVTGAKPQVAVDKDRSLSALPNRLDEIEELLRRLQDQGDTLVAEVAEHTKLVIERRNPPPALPDDQGRYDDLQEMVAEISRQVNQRLHDLEQEAEKSAAAASARLEKFERSVADLEGLWADLEDRFTNLASELRQSVATLSGDIDVASDRGQATPQALAIAITSALQVFPASEPAPSVKKLSAGADAAGLLASNLTTIGLKVSGALIFSQEILAAVTTGRVVFLKGSLAPDVARVIAISLAAVHWMRARIPVGFVDASRLDEDTLQALPTARDSVASLVLDRVNNAPLEVLVDSVAELVRSEGIFVVGTLSDGLSALPEHPLYLQLGPVFDTDVLDWSVFPKADAQISAGALVTLNATALGMVLSSDKPPTDELLGLLRKMKSIRNPRIERAATAYLATLKAFRTTNAPTSLQSVAYGWLWPFWRMVGLGWEERDQQLDGGRLDGDHADARLKLLLELTGPAEK
jgi:hypothetical protein